MIIGETKMALDIVKKVFIILFISIMTILLIFAIPHMYPTVEKEPSPWFELGIDSIKNLLWDSEMQMFRESPNENQSYWIDDNAKLLNIFLENPDKYSGNISNIIKTLREVYHDGYFPRRYVMIKPQIINDDTKNMTIQNGFLRLIGNLSNPYDVEHPLKLQYYEASGHVDFTYLAGQLFTVFPKEDGLYYNSITYDPIRIRADQSQNPGFDNNASEGEYPYLDLLPWEFSYPQQWNFAQDPPFVCVYSTRFVNDDVDGHSRVIGLEVNNEGVEKDWRCNEFSVQDDHNYTFSFYYRGDFTSGSSFRVYVRWFDASHAWMSENYTSYNSMYNSWQYSSYNITSPVNAAYGDIRIVSYADTIGEYYFDRFELGDAAVPNADLELPYNINFRTDVYHSQYRCLHLYGSHDYAKQHLYKTVPVSNFYNLTYWVKVGASTNYYVYVFYTDDTYTQISKSESSTDWISKSVQASELTPGKTIEAIMFHTQTPDIDVFIDDAAINYKPSGASYNAYVQDKVSPYGWTEYVEAIQNYEDDDVNLTIRFLFSKDKAFLTQIMEFENKHDDYKTGIFFHNSFDGLSTITTGEETQKTAYSSVWIPEIGRRTPNPEQWITTLLYDYETWKWSSKHDYFIVELKQIPEWSGCLGLAVKVPNWALHDIINTKCDNTTLWGEDTGKYIHYLTYTFEFEAEKSSKRELTTKILCLNGYDFTNTGVYDYYFMGLDDFDNLDLSMNYHIGMINFVLAKYLHIKGNDPYNMAKTTWSYYNHTFSNHNNGSYLMTTGKMIEASMILYHEYGDSKYLNFSKALSDYLCSLQITGEGICSGNFPMKHNNVTYLDCQGVSIMGLRLMQSFNSSYKTAYENGLKAIKYDYQPSGFHRVPVGYVEAVPHTKRLYVYANTTHIDDDFWTYKASYVARASLASNQTLTMLALSRVWSRTIWKEDSLFIYNSESLPDDGIEGITWDLNSETQPWGLITWYEIAKYQRTIFHYYYEFLEKHNAITFATISETNTHVKIYAPNGIGTVSRFFLKSTDEEYAVPTSIKVDGDAISKTDTLDSLYVSETSCYYYDADLYLLIVKSFVSSSESVDLTINFEMRMPKMWIPILPIMGMIGILMMMISPVYVFATFKEGEYSKAMAYGFILFIVGFSFVIAWLWA